MAERNGSGTNGQIGRARAEAGVTHYANYAPGTYRVRAWAYDSAGNWSAHLLPRFK